MSWYLTKIHALEEIAADCDLIGNLAPDREARRRSKLAARKVRKLASRLSRKHDLVAVEKQIALGGQRIARQKGLIARIDGMHADSKAARDLLAVFEQTQVLFEQRRERILNTTQTPRRSKASRVAGDAEHSQDGEAANDNRRSRT